MKMFSQQNGEDIEETPLGERPTQASSPSIQRTHLPIHNDFNRQNMMSENQEHSDLSNPEISSVEGSFVSLLADIATIERNEEIQNSNQTVILAQQDSSHIVYPPTEFTGEESLHTIDVSNMSVPMSNEDFMAYQNLTYSLTTNESSSGTSQQFVIVHHPIQSIYHTQNTVSTDAVIDSRSSQCISQIDLETNKEFEDAVANIQNEVETVDNVTGNSFLVSTNSQGNVEGVKIITKNASNNINVPNALPAKNKAAKTDTNILKDYQSSTSLKKITVEELHSGKTKSEILNDYLKEARLENNKRKLEKKQKGEVNITADSNTDLLMQKQLTPSNKTNGDRLCYDNNRGKTEDVKEAGEHSQDGVTDSMGNVANPGMEQVMQVSEAAVPCKVSKTDESSLEPTTVMPLTVGVKHHIVTSDKEGTPTSVKKRKLDRVRLAAVRRTRNSGKQGGRDNNSENETKAATSPVKSKICNKNNNIGTENHETQGDFSDTCDEWLDMEGRLADCCKLLNFKDKFVLRLSPITLKSVHKKNLEIYIDISDDLNVKSLEKYKISPCISRYKLCVSRAESIIPPRRYTEMKQVRPPIRPRQKTKLLCKNRISNNDEVIQGDNEFSEENIVRTPSEHDKQKGETTTGEEKVTGNSENTQKAESNDVKTIHSDETIDKHDTNNLPTPDIVYQSESPREDGSGHTDRFIEIKEMAKTKNDKKQPQQESKKKKQPKAYKIRIDEEGRKVYTCGMCSFETPTQKSMYTHCIQHDVTRPYQCEMCGQTFRARSTLNVHTNTHTAASQHTCAECHKSFCDRSNYIQHKKRHTGNKMHMCDYCGKSFVSTSDLKKHMRVHTGEQPFQCSQCQKTFADGSSWRRHTKLHNVKYKFQCSLCNKNYARSDLCKQHIKKTHGTVPPGTVNVKKIDIEEVMEVDTTVDNKRNIKLNNEAQGSGAPVSSHSVHMSDRDPDHGLLTPTVRSIAPPLSGRLGPPKKMWQCFQNLTEVASWRLQASESGIGVSESRDISLSGYHSNRTTSNQGQCVSLSQNAMLQSGNIGELISGPADGRHVYRNIPGVFNGGQGHHYNDVASIDSNEGVDH